MGAEQVRFPPGSIRAVVRGRRDAELSIGVALARRGRRVGSSLLGALVSAAREHGLAAVSPSDTAIGRSAQVRLAERS
jgi:GNAT superfamily N-acetyltransferase